MSKMSKLSQILDEMVSCGENLIQAAKALKDIFSSTEEEKKSLYRRSQRNYFKTWGGQTFRH